MRMSAFLARNTYQASFVRIYRNIKSIRVDRYFITVSLTSNDQSCNCWGLNRDLCDDAIDSVRVD